MSEALLKLIKKNFVVAYDEEKIKNKNKKYNMKRGKMQ